METFKKKENNQLIPEFEVESKLDILVKGQTNNSKQLKTIRDDLQKGFIGLALQNEELLKSIDQLKQQLDEVLKELNAIKPEREKKAARKEARASLPKRDPMTAEIYKKLIKEAEGPTYLDVRLRLTLCLLAVTGVCINKLLNIKVSQLKTITQESWIAIDRSKCGPSNHKAFLTKEGKKIIQDRKKDFQFILLIKELDAYVFISEAKHYQKLRREAITKGVNKVMQSISKQLPGQPNITSHRFRIGYITQLWKDSKDIEFVKQSIGHQKLDTNWAYLTKLSDQERQERMDLLE